MIVRKVYLTEKELYKLGCFLPLIIGIIIGIVAWFNNSEIGYKWHVTHADNERDAAWHAVWYMAEYPGGGFYIEAEDIAIKYYSKQYDPIRCLNSDFSYSKDDDIKDIVKSLENKLGKSE